MKPDLGNFPSFFRTSSPTGAAAQIPFSFDVFLVCCACSCCRVLTYFQSY